MSENLMTSNKPYLIRALHEWICDNECTPYIYVNTATAGLQLPEHLFAENPLILNVSPNACNALSLDKDSVSFQARFGGQVFEVFLPMGSIIAIVARENGQGMTFDWSSSDEGPSSEESLNNNDNAPEKKTNNGNPKGGLKVLR